MIEKIDIIGNDYEIEPSLKNYVEKRLSKLDRYLPRGYKKDVVIKVVVSSIGHQNGDRYEISVAMEIPGGKVLTAKDECSNIFAGVDLVETKLAGQIRRLKLEVQPHLRRRNWKQIFTLHKNNGKTRKNRKNS